MIYVITGATGAGKTLYALNFVVKQFPGRRIVHNSINGLTLDWEVLDEPSKWFEQPDGTVIVIDECQKHFPPRANGSQVPRAVEEMQTHRHRGFDLVLITQHPMLIDAAIRRLIENPNKHFHVRRTFGLNRATVHEFEQINDNPTRSTVGSTRHEWQYPKASFDWYKSSSLHTGKVRIPTKVFVLLVLPLVIAGLVYYLYSIFNNHTDKSVAPSVQQPFEVSQKQPLISGHQEQPIHDLAAYQPRIQGLAFTAPRYDQVNMPRVAPRPSMCISARNRCRCYTDQGTRLDMEDSLCRDIAEKGFYDDTREPVGDRYRLQPSDPPHDPKLPISPAAV